jgi:hypothetical protein
MSDQPTHCVTITWSAYGTSSRHEDGPELCKLIAAWCMGGFMMGIDFKVTREESR